MQAFSHELAPRQMRQMTDTIEQHELCVRIERESRRRVVRRNDAITRAPHHEGREPSQRVQPMKRGDRLPAESDYRPESPDQCHSSPAIAQACEYQCNPLRLPGRSARAGFPRETDTPREKTERRSHCQEPERKGRPRNRQCTEQRVDLASESPA